MAQESFQIQLCDAMEHVWTPPIWRRKDSDRIVRKAKLAGRERERPPTFADEDAERWRGGVRSVQGSSCEFAKKVQFIAAEPVNLALTGGSLRA